MKPIKFKYIVLLTGALLAITSVDIYAAESHMVEALTHTEAAVKAADGNAVNGIVEHAEAAKAHAKTASEHLNAGITSLNDAIDHGKMKHADLAKKSAAEALTHLKAAQ